MRFSDQGYKFDIVFVIDATDSMRPIIDGIKAQALTLGDRMIGALESCNKIVRQLRVRLVEFGDFAYETYDAIRQTDFFSLPEEKAKFEQAIKSIDCEHHGGDKPENGLEALFVAMSSDWTPIERGEMGRHIIVLMTDAYPLHLMERRGVMGYDPTDFPMNIRELQSVWNADEQIACPQLSPTKRRLLLVAPKGEDEEGHSWESVMGWKNTIYINVEDSEPSDYPLFDAIVCELVRS